jgi:hypothetical protein
MHRLHTLYTYGYTGTSPLALKELAQQLDAVVLDIRLSPRSRNPEWTKARLSGLLGARYEHLQAWGNVNYKNGGPVVFKDVLAGVQRLRERLSAGPVILLCACTHVANCHRLDAAQHAQMVWPDLDVVHIQPGDVLLTPNTQRPTPHAQRPTPSLSLFPEGV